MTKKVVLITGCAGFVGTHMSIALLDRGYTVIGIDNFFSGKVSNIEMISQQFGNSFKFIEGDIRSEKIFKEVDQKVNSIIHLAAQVSVTRSLALPLETHEINVTGFLRVLDFAKKKKVGHFIYASSCAVYGNQNDTPIKENARPCPDSPYGVSKLADELYASCAVSEAGGSKMNIIGLRFFNLFGPLQDPANPYASVIPKWVSEIVAGKRPTIFGNGDATRDYCHVENVLSAIFLCLSKPPQNLNKVYNVGTGVSTSLNRLLFLINEVFLSENHSFCVNTPKIKPWRDGEILHSSADLSLVEKELNFSVTTHLSEGLRELITIAVKKH